MTRKIKASEVREDMEIEWSDQGWYHRGVVAAVTRNHPGGVWVQSSDGFEMSVEPDQVFTVLTEPQPEEPTAFGACVEAAGRKYVRADNSDDIPWAQPVTSPSSTRTRSPGWGRVMREPIHEPRCVWVEGLKANA